jgi:predicted nucleic acid-binding protein
MRADPERQLVDTNVLVYAHDVSAGPKAARARQLLDELWSTGRGCVSIQILQEFYVTVTRMTRRVLDPATASEVVADLGTWLVHAPTPADVLAAIALHRRRRIAFWDAMVMQSAAQLGCQTVWSEDLSAGQAYNGVTVRNPFR